MTPSTSFYAFRPVYQRPLVQDLAKGKMKFLRSLVFICSVGPLLGASEGGEAGGHGETTSSEERKSFKVTPCAISHAKLNVVLRELVDESLEIYVNCLSFDRKASLVNGVVSGVNMSANPSSPGIRLVLSCVEDVIAARPSLEAPILQKMNSTACLSCVDQPTNVCMDGKNIYLFLRSVSSHFASLKCGLKGNDMIYKWTHCAVNLFSADSLNCQHVYQKPCSNWLCCTSYCTMNLKSQSSCIFLHHGPITSLHTPPSLSK